MLRVVMLLMGAALLCTDGSATAQDYPARPVRIIFPLAAGGGGDVYTRALADEFQKAWHQPVVVENRPGGGQNIGARACAEATPDGYTLCVMSSEPTVYNQYLYKSIPYDPQKDFQPISNLFFNTLAVVANGELKVKSFAELLALAKAKPGTMSYATFSYPLTYFMERLKKTEGIDIVKVPYRGGGEVVNALLGGSLQMALLALSNMVPQLQSGRITPLAVVANGRSPLFPDVATQGGARRALSADLVRAVHARLGAAADRRQDRPRRRPHHGGAPFPPAHLCRARRRARARAHRRVRPLHRRGAQARRADRQGVRRAAEIEI